MSVRFYTQRAFPSDLRLNGLGNMNTESAVADIFRSLTVGAVDFFGGSSSFAKEAAANAAAAQAQVQLTQAQLYGQQDYERSRTIRTLILVGGGIAAVALIATVITRSRSHVAGYRRKRRRARR